MKNVAFWKRDWVLGVLTTLLVLGFSGSDLMQSLERKAYDLGVGLTTRTPSDKVAVIAIDKQSIDNIGRWPWPRDIYAAMIEKLAAAKAKVITPTIFFSEPQIDPGLGYINKLIDIYDQAGGVALSMDKDKVAAQPALLGQLGSTLREAELRLNTDRRMAESYEKAGNVVLPMLFRLGDPMGRPDHPLPDFMTSNAVKLTSGDGGLIPSADVDAMVIDELGRYTAGVGHLNVTPDVDGGIRTEPLALGYFDQAYPSLALLAAARSLNLTPADIVVKAGESVSLGRLKIATDRATRMNTFFYRGSTDSSGEGMQSAFPVDSFFDVLTGKIPLDKYRDKIVLIGPTVAGVGGVFVTPVSPAMSAVMMQAHTISSILSEHFFVTPAWAVWTEKAVFVVIALYLIFVLPRLSAGMGATATLLLLILLLGAHFGLMSKQMIWLQFMVPATLLLFGHTLLTTKRFLTTESGKQKSDLDSAESNRMLGLAFQGQGQLDMAFDKFRKCPVDEPLLENLYNLALDFERKRQFNKAASVFGYIQSHNPKFRDITQRLTRAKQMSDTVILGGGVGMTKGGTLILDGNQLEKPMLGRYQVEKELGKGAMGTVYLGRDPKINRVVTIKTMALSDEFEGDELDEVKHRFFREAETAGRLNHQNIVTIFDAGEEHDLAYIAMEFLRGNDLVPHTQADNLLPLTQLMSIIARVADALDYAHVNQVVHRDIKPANIMFEAQTDQVKVTDFGIARITDTSKTKTGMVLGTPSYMSPEQLSGKHLDGRSDLFSLGVMLYQLASGRLPFDGDSMAQLMFKIANEPHGDIRDIRPDIPECLAVIIDRALVKDPEKRYQTGAAFAADVRDCLASCRQAPDSKNRTPE